MAKELEELFENPTVQTLLDSAGFVGQPLTLTNAHVAVQQMMMHEVLNKRRCEMVDISNGMATLSLQKLLSACPDLVEVVFPKALPLDPSLLKGLLRVDPNHLGIPENENALTWLKMYIDDFSQGK